MTREEKRKLINSLRSEIICAMDCFFSSVQSPAMPKEAVEFHKNEFEKQVKKCIGILTNWKK